jgi:hypothetical protein
MSGSVELATRFDATLIKKQQSRQEGGSIGIGGGGENG